MTPSALQELLLQKRGLSADKAGAGAAARESFLHPEFEAGLSDPFLLHDMRRAVDRISKAFDANESIAIYADYDADGVPGAAVLVEIFRQLGHENIRVYLPHRHTEGYGLHDAAVSGLIDEGVTLIITVDVGIVGHSAVDLARERGIDVIITDHHEPIGIPPEAFAVVNPKLGEYPDRMLCGAAVAFRLAQALIRTLRESDSERVRDLPPGFEKWSLDLVGIATLSDMVPLVGENRIFATFGMRVLQKCRRPGLRELLRKAKIEPSTMTEEDVVFTLTPRLNAASRMAHPEDAFELLVTTDPLRAGVLASHLDSLSTKRKSEVARIMKEVHKLLAGRELRDVIVIGHPEWHHGVLGLIAAKICETYERSAFVWAIDGEIVRGSCRAWGDVSMVRLMESSSSSFTQFGGHDGAGGFTTTRELLHGLEETLSLGKTTALRDVSDEQPSQIDAKLTLSDVTLSHYDSIRTLAPFGMANEKPTFMFRVTIDSVRQFGKTAEHLELYVIDETVRRPMKAMTFFKTAEDFGGCCVPGATVDLSAHFDYSVFMNRPELRLRIVDIQPVI